MPDQHHDTPAPGETSAPPSYPLPGTLIRPDAVDSLLPRGTAPEQARVVAVHAHPDDETLVSGLALASLGQAGAQVHLITMTRGERGEVMIPELAHLEVGHPDNHDDGTALGAYREGELAAACRALGVEHHVYAGQSPALDAQTGFPGGGDRFMDSGMSWSPEGRAQPAEDVSPKALTAAGVDQAAAHVAAALREIRPHAVLSYDDDGGYGHPDHVRTARVLARALELLEDESGAEPALRPLAWAIEGQPDPQDERPQAVVHADEASRAARHAAMRAHATQIETGDDPADPRYELSNRVPQTMPQAETFRLIGGDAARLAPREPAR